MDPYCFYEWTKRLGQRHWACVNDNTAKTLCGRPMLGNNYANYMEEIDKADCEECALIKDQYTINKEREA